MKSFWELINNRQSCRNFDSSRAVEKEELLAVLSAGMLSPSARNLQPWTFVAATGKTAEKVKRACQIGGANPFLDNCHTYIVVTQRGGEFSPVKVAKDQATAQDFRRIDIGIAVAHMCLAAEEQNLATCIIGRYNSDTLSEILETSEPISIVVALGHAADGDAIRTKNRRTAEETVRYLD